ncbi:SET domain-containing protein [Cryphonectria parasitica EP155]|uniref:SET domain-containing protein n=1 Tax=Cryphonectria parasitica (strain ATCC 38755 / EP155) TaxID=660469 RepID=A0A9P4XWY3_CRYP1|nr:SET domain-containing protein [Cryphonectria parasitica EP155]KAF3762280.1 SET domain-containing protein [Cryphonectria parasitica EP155]
MDETLKGQLPTRRKDRAQLIETHNAYLKKQDQNRGAVRAVKQPVASEAYPPCIKALNELKIIALSELRIESHHREEAVIIKTISNAYRGAASVSLVEDEHGTVEKLAMYNQSDASILSALPEGCVLAVKEPYYQIDGIEKDQYIICVDHPSDVVLLRLSDPIIPRSLRVGLDRTAEDWKKAGDDAFLVKDFPFAVFCYTQGIDISSNESSLQQNLMAKRAGINLALARYDHAKHDALASLTGASSDWKAYLIAGRAAYGLRDYQTSHENLKRALELNPDGVGVKREVDRCLSRLSEQSRGSFDFRQMSESIHAQSVHLDSATFTARTKIAASSLHGQGIFAKEDIKAGEVVFVEKAMTMPHQYETSLAAAALYAIMVRQLCDNPPLAKDFFSLYGGDYTRSGLEGKIIDGTPVIDVWLVEAIRRNNCFSAPRSTRDETRPDVKGVSQTKGFWAYAAHMNHSCVPNTARSFIGDMLISRAKRDIAAGEELLQNYTNIKAHYGRRQGDFGIWGFQCTCELCQDESRSTDENSARRERLLAQIEKLANKKPPRGVVPDATIRSMERLTRELEEAHEADVYDELPRLMLIYPTQWLLEAYKGRKNRAKCVASALRVLRNFGFPVSDGEDPMTLFQEHGNRPSVLTIHVVTALRDAARDLSSIGRKDAGKQFEKAAKFAYMLLTGFEEDLDLLNEP